MKNFTDSPHIYVTRNTRTISPIRNSWRLRNSPSGCVERSPINWKPVFIRNMRIFACAVSGTYHIRAIAIKSMSGGDCDSARNGALPNKLRKGDLYGGAGGNSYIAQMAIRSRQPARRRGCDFKKACPMARAMIAPARRALQFCLDTKLRLRGPSFWILKIPRFVNVPVFTDSPFPIAWEFGLKKRMFRF